MNNNNQASNHKVIDL